MSHPPHWVEEFVQQISYCLFPDDQPSPLGCHCHCEQETWEIALFPSMRKTSWTSENNEGVRPTRFAFDIQQASQLFEELQHMDWIAMPSDEQNEAGPHLLLEGIVAGESVLIRICAEVPPRFQHDDALIIQQT